MKMRFLPFLWILLFGIYVLASMAPCPCQQSAGGIEPLDQAAGIRHARWVDRALVPGQEERYGGSLWNNMAFTAWWSGMQTGYTYLDWGKLPDPSSGLVDHVIDGFTFCYATNNYEDHCEEFAIYYFDSCTGWGSKGVMEAGFLFTQLPGAAMFPD